MQLKENQVIQNVKSGDVAPVYLLTGAENYFIDKVSDFFETQFIDEGMRDFDQTVVYGRDVDVRTLIDLAKRFPVMSPYQLILVKEAQDLPAKGDGWDKFADYCANPQRQSVIVLCYRHKKFDKRLKAYKAINTAGVVMDTVALYDNQMPDWVAKYAKSKGYSMTERSAVLLSEYLGNNLSKIVNEMDKLFISLPPNSIINDDVVEQNIGISKEYNVFELQKAIGSRDIAKCNRIVKHFADTPKENPIQVIIPTLYSYIINLMIYIQDPSQLKINPYFLKDYAEAARNYTLPKLASCVGYLYDADVRSKGVNNKNATSGEILKELVFKIIH